MPSTTWPPLPTPVLTAVSVVAPAAHPLRGAGAGSYVEARVVPDVGRSFTLTGAVSLAGLGAFRVSGWVQGVGMVANGRALGRLVLTNGGGSITLELHGAVQPGFGPLPRQFVYSVSAGTGAYRGLAGYGSVAMSLTPAPTAFGLPPRGIVGWSFS